MYVGAWRRFCVGSGLQAANLWCPWLVCDPGAEKSKSLCPRLLVAVPAGKGRSKLNSHFLLRASKAPFPDHQETQGLLSCSLICAFHSVPFSELLLFSMNIQSLISVFF